MNILLDQYPAPTQDGIRAFFNLMAIVADPKEAAKVFLKFDKMVDESVKADISAQETEKKLEAARTEHDERLKAERDEHDRTLADAKAIFEAQCAKAMDEVRTQRERAAKLEAQAKGDAEAAAALRSDLQTRVNKIKSAVA
jgi:hypothetical protein